MINLNGKKTYISLLTSLLGVIAVTLDAKYPGNGLKDWGMPLIVAGLGGAAYSRSVAGKVSTPVKKTRKSRIKKVVGNA